MSVKVNIGKDLLEFARKFNLKPEAILQEVANQLPRVLALYKDQLKSKKLPLILEDLKMHTQLGFEIDRRKIGEVLKHENFHLEDFDVDLGENYFWFHWTASRGKVDEIDLTLKNGVPTITYVRFINKRLAEKIKRILKYGDEDFYGEDMDYDCDYEIEVEDEEFPQLRLTLRYDDSGLDFPDVQRISRIFNRLEQKASKLHKK
ncbi:MAG: hypothetical protein ACXQTV_04350 [Candidatus Hecatellaceae archaeon]